MKKRIAWTLVLACIFAVCGCNDSASDSAAEQEAVSADYGRVTELAKAEFLKIFREFEDVQIKETATMARTDDVRQVVVQFKYVSDHGTGAYGFLYHLDDCADPELVRYGGDSAAWVST